MNKNPKKCSEHVFGKPFGPNTLLFRIKKRWFCKCYLCNTRKMLTATLRCLECRVFVHDRCMLLAATQRDPGTENVRRGQTVVGSLQDSTAEHGTRASKDVATDRETIMAEPGSSVANCNSPEMTALATIEDNRKSDLNVPFTVPDDVHSAATAAANGGGDSGPAIVLQADEMVPVAAVADVRYSATADVRTEIIDGTGTSADEIAVSCRADAAGTAMAACEKDTAVVSRDNCEVQSAPVDGKASIPAVVSQDNHELPLAPIDVGDSIPVAVAQDDHAISRAPIDAKDSTPAAALAQDDGKIDVRHSVSTDGCINTDIGSASANVALIDNESVPDVDPQDDGVMSTTLN